MTPLERADRVREHVAEYMPIGHARADELLPPGSLILTPDEAEKLRGQFTGDLELNSAEALALLDGREQT